MTPATTLSLFGAMVILALIPGPGIFVVVARAMASGFGHGSITAVGIVFGDYVFIVLSILGLVALTEALGSFFVVLKYLAAAYLLWLAFSLWRSASGSADIQGVEELSFASNFFAGFFTTLGNPKAMLFYLGFFPAFLELSTVSMFDIALIMVVATLSVGGVMLGYAYAASKAKVVLSSERCQRNISRSASGVMACSGILLAIKT